MKSLAVIVGLLLGLVGAARAETVTLSFEECVSIAPAIVSAYKMERAKEAISQTAQRVVDANMAEFRAEMDQLIKSGALPDERVLEYLDRYVNEMGMQCLQIASMTGGEIQTDIE